MEEKSIIHTAPFQSTYTDWKLRHNMYQTFRNYRQLQNRINILEFQKKKKLKDIENKLNNHKKFVQLKIYKHQLKSAIDITINEQEMRSTSNSKLFRAIQDSRSLNKKKRQQEILVQKMKKFEEIKKKRMQNQQKIKLCRLQKLDQNISKRNKVRLLQIGCKQNIQNFWNGRLQSYQQHKKLETYKKLKIHEQNVKKLEKLQNQENNLLQDIKRTQQVENQLNSMIQVQKSMQGEHLDNLYFSKVANLNNN